MDKVLTVATQLELKLNGYYVLGNIILHYSMLMIKPQSLQSIKLTKEGLFILKSFSIQRQGRLWWTYY